MKYTGMDQEKLRKAFEPQAERQVKVRLALEKIAEQEKLVASDEDIEKEYRKMADQYKTDVDKIKAVVEKEALASDLAVEKAIDFVRDQADVMDAPAEKKKKSTKATAAKKTKATKSSATKKAADKKDSAE